MGSGFEILKGYKVATSTRPRNHLFIFILGARCPGLRGTSRVGREVGSSGLHYPYMTHYLMMGIQLFQEHITVFLPGAYVLETMASTWCS